MKLQHVNPKKDVKKQKKLTKRIWNKKGKIKINSEKNEKRKVIK